VPQPLEHTMEEHVWIGKQSSGWPQRWSPLWWRQVLRQDLAGLRKHRFILRNLVSTKLKVRYQRSALGFLWALLHPVLMLSVLAVVFSQVMRINLAQYAVYLFSGLVPWQFFSDAVTNGSYSLITNEMLIKKVNVQKLVFPLGDLLVAAVNMSFAMGALFIVFCFVGARVHPQLILLPAGLVLLLLFTFGIVLLQMTLVTYFRDFEHITQVLLQVFYFACPIMYPPEMIGRYAGLLEWNPMTHLLRFFQCAFFYGTWPAPRVWLAAMISSLVSLALGYAVYKRYEHDYVFRL